MATIENNDDDRLSAASHELDVADTAPLEPDSAR